MSNCSALHASNWLVHALRVTPRGKCYGQTKTHFSVNDVESSNASLARLARLAVGMCVTVTLRRTASPFVGSCDPEVTDVESANACQAAEPQPTRHLTVLSSYPSRIRVLNPSAAFSVNVAALEDGRRQRVLL